MSDFFTSLLLVTLLSVFFKGALLKGEDSPLFPPLKFLLSLITIVIVISPILSFLQKKDLGFTLSSLETEIFTQVQAEEKILKETEAQIRSSVQKTFPQTAVTVTLLSDDTGIPTHLEISCEEEMKERIISFLEKNYNIPVKIKIEE